MRIGLVGGTGKEGRGLAARWARAGHDVIVGSRDAARARDVAAALGVRGGDNLAACDADVVVLCVPYPAHAATVEALAPALAGRLVIDLVVPLAPPDVGRVRVPEGGAAALEAQRILGDRAQVVATLHHVSSAHLAEVDRPIGCDVLVAGDDPSARERAIRLVGDLGLRGVDAGPLANAVALEAMTAVLLYLNKRYGKPGLGLRIEGL